VFDGKEWLNPEQAACQLFSLRHLYAGSDSRSHLFFLRRFRAAAHRKFVAQLQQPAKIDHQQILSLENSF
jgi:hypothetical protein